MLIVKSHTLDEIRFENEFISGRIPHSISWFCRFELGSTQIVRWYQSLSKFHWATHNRATRVMLQMSHPRRAGGVTTPALDEIKSGNEFISGRHPSLYKSIW